MQELWLKNNSLNALKKETRSKEAKTAGDCREETHSSYRGEYHHKSQGGGSKSKEYHNSGNCPKAVLSDLPYTLNTGEQLFSTVLRERNPASVMRKLVLQGPSQVIKKSIHEQGQQIYTNFPSAEEIMRIC
ncbi:hypothetical protein CHS0354_035883 [Potamilus streckersoni]|uniref:Uncharacterized protein n=1 Tax=Potamilus streckersoni TaxID=2493646 RepID=A0AAE0SRQ2_9BIVA|nr:hypothetical protein CHS0354_035883 [Potamilus streckersoni]